MDEELVFVQYFGIHYKDVVAKDDVYQKRNFVRLKSKAHDEDDGKREKGKVYALCSLDSLRGWVHVIQSKPLVLTGV